MMITIQPISARGWDHTGDKRGNIEIGMSNDETIGQGI
jgi:hypothetical protein